MRAMPAIAVILSCLCLASATASEAPRQEAFIFSTLSVSLAVAPTNDPGHFNLLVDGMVRATAAGNGGSTGTLSTAPGTHTVSVTGTSGTSVANYGLQFGGNCSAGGIVQISSVQHAACTVTATRNGLHGIWTRGPGQRTFTACVSNPGCDLKGPANTIVPLIIEVWSGGGGGGGGENGMYGAGRGGGGGAGGVYDTRTYSMTIPATGVSTLYVLVAAGGQAGYVNPGVNQTTNGQPGGNSTVWTGGFYSGSELITVTGGNGGHTGVGPAYGYNDGLGGTQGTGGPNAWLGTPGFAGGVTTGCYGAAGGLGGAGGGPGRTGPYVNDGGHGGHGGYHHGGLFSCTKSMDLELSDGAFGGNGKVTISW